MGFNDGLSMNYFEMEAQLQSLQTDANEFEELVGRMMNNIAVLCENWKSSSTESYREDYEKLTQNFRDTIEIIRQLIASNQNYIKDMQNTDSAYTGNRVG